MEGTTDNGRGVNLDLNEATLSSLFYRISLSTVKTHTCTITEDRISFLYLEAIVKGITSECD